MYIRKTVSKYKDKIYTNYLLVRSVLTPKGPRQKVIRSLGSLKPRSHEEWKASANKLQAALVGQETIEPHSQEVDSHIPVIVGGAGRRSPLRIRTPSLSGSAR